MNVTVFSFEKDHNLIVASIKNSVGFFLGEAATETGKYDFAFHFSGGELIKFTELMHSVAHNAWPDIKPKECTSFGADYSEYYDKDLDNNGYLTLKKDRLIIERPSAECPRMYLFNKSKMQSFLFDLDRMVNE